MFRERTVIWGFVGVLLVAGAVLARVDHVVAQSAIENFKAGAVQTVSKTGINTSTDATALPRLAGTLIGRALSLIGVLFFLIILIAGFIWMFSMGNETRTQHAKNTIVAAVGGLIVILGSYAITSFAYKTIERDKTSPSISQPTEDGNRGFCGAGAFAGAECFDESVCEPQARLVNGVCAAPGQVCCRPDDVFSRVD